MKRNIIIISGLVIFLNLCIGQDKITRTNGEKVKCQITAIDSTLIYFNLIRNDIKYNTHLKLEDVSSYRWKGKDYLLHDIDSCLIISQKNELIKEKEQAKENNKNRPYSFGPFTSIEFGFGVSSLKQQQILISGEEFGLGKRYCFKFNFTLPGQKMVLSPSFLIKSYKVKELQSGDIERGLTMVNVGLRFSYRLIASRDNYIKLHGFIDANYNEIYDNYTWEETIPITINGSNTVTESLNIYKGKTLSPSLGLRFQASVIYFEILYDLVSANVELGSEMKELLDKEGTNYDPTFRQSFKVSPGNW